MSRILTRLFDRFSDAQHAVIELEEAGVPHGDISLVSHTSDTAHSHFKHRDVHDKTAGEAAAAEGGASAVAGGVLGAAGGVLTGLGLMAIPGLGPVVAAGWLATAAVGAVAGAAVLGAAGGLVGALTHNGVSEAEAHIYAEAIRRGATLVSVKVDDKTAPAVEALLQTMPIVDVAARGAAYRKAGWSGFDEAAPPYTDAEIVIERTRYLRA